MSEEARPTILLTGFAPFGPYRINSSWEAARLAARRLGPRIVVARLPVHRARAAEALAYLLEEHKPAACLLTGLARGGALRIERVARRPRALAGSDRPISLTGTWPVAETGLALRGSKLPYRVSLNAGRYVCDSTYWALLDFRLRKGWPRHACFLHVPPLSRRFNAGRLAAAMERILRRRLVRT
jgi:pyroglutamyl-peptidase